MKPDRLQVEVASDQPRLCFVSPFLVIADREQHHTGVSQQHNALPIFSQFPERCISCGAEATTGAASWPNLLPDQHDCDIVGIHSSESGTVANAFAIVEFFSSRMVPA